MIRDLIGEGATHLARAFTGTGELGRYWDTLGMMRQLGLLPSNGSSPAGTTGGATLTA